MADQRHLVMADGIPDYDCECGESYGNYDFDGSRSAKSNRLNQRFQPVYFQLVQQGRLRAASVGDTGFRKKKSDIRSAFSAPGHFTVQAVPDLRTDGSGVPC